MDSKLQQSFIPRESLGGGASFGPGPGLGIFALIAIIIFLISAGAFGITYLYKQSVIKEISKLDADLARMREIFQPATVAEFKKLNNRLAVADKLINNHTAPSRIFDVLEKETLKSVYFSGFSLTGDEGEFSVSLVGVAKNFNSVALQSDAFGKNQSIKNPIFSNFNLDEKGNVVFSVTVSVDPTLLFYKDNFIQTEQ